ncbi:Os07g0188050, partial [Oryza sativa Japonica Group]
MLPGERSRLEGLHKHDGCVGLRVTQIVSEHLQLIGTKTVLVMENVVVGWSACSLDSGMAAQVEVELTRVANVSVNHGSCIYTRKCIRHT